MDNTYKFHTYPNIDPETSHKIIIGDLKYLQLVYMHGEPPKIKSPVSSRKIGVNKIEYKKLIKQGYTDDQLLYDLILPFSKLTIDDNDITTDDTNMIIDKKNDIIDNTNMIIDKKTDITIDDIKTDKKPNKTLNKTFKNITLSTKVKINIFFGHLCLFVLKDCKLYGYGNNNGQMMDVDGVLNCCCSMFRTYIYTKNGLYCIDEFKMKFIPFDFKIKLMHYSFGYIFIVTGGGDLYLLNDYSLEFIDTKVKNVKLMSSCHDHVLLLCDYLYYVNHQSYLDIKGNMKRYNVIDKIIKLASSNNHDLILTKYNLYGIKNQKLTVLELDNVIDISCSDTHAMILTSSNIYGFGDNSSGQLGNTIPFVSPNNTINVYCGRHSTIIKTENQFYGLGDFYVRDERTKINYTTPTIINFN